MLLSGESFAPAGPLPAQVGMGADLPGPDAAGGILYLNRPDRPGTASAAKHAVTALLAAGPADPWCSMPGQRYSGRCAHSWPGRLLPGQPRARPVGTEPARKPYLGDRHPVPSAPPHRYLIPVLRRRPNRDWPGAHALTGGAPPSAPSATAATAAVKPTMVASADGLPVVTTAGLTRSYGGTGLFEVDLAVPRGWVPAWSASTALARRRCPSYCRHAAS